MHVPILPIAHNAGWVWPKGVMGKRPGTITLSIGKPIAAGSRGRAAEFMQAVETGSKAEVARLGPADAQRTDARLMASIHPARRVSAPAQERDIVLGGRAIRLPAGSRAAALDRHGRATSTD